MRFEKIRKIQFRKSLLCITLITSALVGGAALANDNGEITIAPLLARTNSATHYTFGPFTNFGWRGIRIFMKQTVLSGVSATLDCKVQGKDPVGGNWQDLVGAAFPQVTATAAPTPLVIYPGLTAVTNKVTNDILPRTWRMDCLVGPGANAGTGFTFSLGGALEQ